MQYQSRTYDPVSGEVISQRGGVPLPGTEPHTACHTAIGLRFSAKYCV